MKKNLLLCALALALCATPGLARQKRRNRKPRVTQTPGLVLDPKMFGLEYVPRASIAPGQVVWCEGDPPPAGTEYGYTFVGKTDPQGCRGDAVVIELPKAAELDVWRERSEQAGREWRAYEAEEGRKNELAIAAHRLRLGMNQTQARRSWGSPTRITKRKDDDGNDLETWLYRSKGSLLFFNDWLDRIVEY